VVFRRAVPPPVLRPSDSDPCVLHLKDSQYAFEGMNELVSLSNFPLGAKVEVVNSGPSPFFFFFLFGGTGAYTLKPLLYQPSFFVFFFFNFYFNSAPRYQAETILPLSLILLKREYKQ
jgi:hypothetical protein